MVARIPSELIETLFPSAPAQALFSVKEPGARRDASRARTRARARARESASTIVASRLGQHSRYNGEIFRVLESTVVPRRSVLEIGRAMYQSSKMDNSTLPRFELLLTKCGIGVPKGYTCTPEAVGS